MQTRKLEIACPSCGSKDVFYSCEPKCCFNHVCENCRTTFEPVTTPTGARRAGMIAPNPLPDCTEPTVACAKCESTAVYALPDGDATVCTQCGAVLAVELTEISPG